jgi:hypothetical protein
MGGETFLAKADQQVSDFTSNGLIPPEKSEKWIQVAIKESDLIKRFRHVTFKGETREINQMEMGNRVLRPGGERVVLTQADRAQPNLSKTVLAPKHFRAEYRVSFDVLEDQIEQETFLPTMEAELPKAITRDLVDVFFNGDTVGTGDSTSKVLDGLAKQITTNTIDFGGDRFGKTAAEAMYRKLPSQHRDKTKLIFAVSPNAELDYGFSVSSRMTPEGDRAMFTGIDNPKWFGVPIVQNPLIPENLEVSTDRTYALLLDPQKVWVGWKREIKLVVVKDEVVGEYIIVAHMRVDVKIEREQAAVKGYDILAS